jgi:nitrogen fixation NifU-like protein
MSLPIDELYQTIILEHYKHPRHAKAVCPCTHKASGYNPLCGDKLEVTLLVDEGRIAQIGCQCEGCAISKASGSLMTEHLKGLEVPVGLQRIETLCQTLSDVHAAPLDPQIWEDALCLVGVRQFYSRIKCATLAWRAAQAALLNDSAVSTEGPSTT